MENVMNYGFVELSNDEMTAVDGGGFVAGVYALGFVFGMSPLGAVALCAGAVVVGAGIAIACA